MLFPNKSVPAKLLLGIEPVGWAMPTLLTHVTQKPKKVSETAIPSEIAAKP